MQSQDQDFRLVTQSVFSPILFHALRYRFMGLNDLMTEVKQDASAFQGDEAVENKVLKQVLDLVQDKISEVKNQAVKWRVFLCRCLRPSEYATPQSRTVDQDFATSTNGICGRQTHRILWRER